MKTTDLAGFALNTALYVAVGVLFSSAFPLTFEGVRFWPQVIIPAIFAVVFGPWVGGFGAAVGIFLSDVILGNNPLLSLMAGVTSNFLGFWLLGFIANMRVRLAVPAALYGLATVLLAWIAYIYTSLIYAGIIISCYVVFLAIVLSSSKWRSYEAGSVVGLLVGSAIIGAMVPLFAQLFTPLGQTPLAPFTLAGGFALFIWTFSTEIPFLLILGPPIIEAVRQALPNIKSKNQSEDQA
jgi:hypothetical protein